MTQTYTVIEDNAGGLHLFVFDQNVCTYAGHGFETGRGALAESVQAIRDGENTDGWEGEENANTAWAEMESSMDQWPHGYKIVADQNGIYADRMGVAASTEFAAMSP